jgi:hypothetical protein
MTPSQILAIARDVVILAALGFVVWWIWRSGEDRIKVQDITAVQEQLKANAKQLADWKKESADADAQRATDLQGVRDLIAHGKPLVVRLAPAAPGPGAVPGAATGASGGAACPGSADAGSGSGTRTVDLRPAIAALETRYETALADCRAVLAKWPH